MTHAQAGGGAVRARDAEETERRFAQLAGMLAQVFWIVDLEPAMHMPYVSPAFEAIWGRPARALYDDPGLWEASILPQDRRRYHEAYTRWSEDPESAPGYDVEYRIRRPDGEIRWIAGRGQAVRGASGRIVRLIGFAEDVTARKEAEAAADQSQRHLRELIDSLPQLLWSASPSGDCEYVNPQWAAYTGRPLEAHLGSAWVEVVHGDDIPVLLQAWREANAHRAPYDCELRLRRHDGQYRWMTMRAVPLKDESGRVLRWLGSCTDTNALKQAGAALADEHDRLLKIAFSVPSAIHSYRVAADGHTSLPFGAERVGALYGLPPEVLVHDASGLRRRVHPADAAALDAAVLDSASRMTPWYAEFRIQHPAGGERWIEGRSMPTREADGSIVWHGALTDVSDRKRDERALHANRAQLAAIFDDLTEGLIIFDVDAQEAVYNRAAFEIHGLPVDRGALVTMQEYLQHFELLDLDGRVIPVEDWPLSRALHGERIVNRELALRHRRDGWQKVLNASASTVRGLEGQATAVVLSISDITQRHRHQAEIEQMNQQLEARVARRTAALAAAVEEMEAFSYSVSHDLRAPLRALDGFSQAVLQDHAALLPPAGQQYLRIIRDSAKKMGQLIDDLLAFSRISRVELKKRPVDTGWLVRDAFAVLAPMREGRSVELNVDPALPPSLGDIALLRQVWVNLLSNALKYSRGREPAVIEVGSRRDADTGQVAYYVRDNGTGFDMRYEHKLFRVFERLHRQEDFEGTGVGLAIVQRIVVRHGGTIRAEAEPGRGATFLFTLGD